jgi:hypothetical protein
MPLPGDSAGRGRRPQWPLAAVWAASVASLLAVALLPRAAAHAYGMLLLAGSAGALITVLVYARLLRRSMTPPLTVLLVGGPWDGQMLLARAGPMPEEIQLAGPGAPPCSYRRRAGDRDRPQLRVLRYEPDDGTGPGGRSLAAGAPR